MGKTVLITGASGGIGSACARAFAKDGWQTALHFGKNETSARALRDALRAMGCDAEVFSADAACPAQVNACVDAVLARFGRIDALVCCAGVAQQKLFTDLTDEDWRRMLDADLGGVFAFDRAVLPEMLRRGAGAIVNLSSVWGVCGASCEVAYSATKGGINAMTRALAKELAPSSIQVNAIACGAIDTEMNQFLDEEERNALLEEIPAGRMGRAEEVGKLAYQLGSENSYLTGQIIQLDGGWI